MTHSYFNDNLAERDPLIFKALQDEKKRQQGQIELIASENSVSFASLEAIGSVITNKTVEGYPGKRFHGGADFADVVEQAAIDRAKELFGCGFVNVQPHSGTQANQAVFFALLQPGDTVLSLDLASGGHLSHGAKPNQSGRWFSIVSYGVDRETGRIDYDNVEALALEHKPKLIISGGSSYPREIDFPRMREIADKVGATYLVDMAHFAGLVAAGVHPSPIPHADIVTCTTTKTLRGARGGLVMTNREDLFKKLQPAVFPGVQGSAHLATIAGKAVCLGEALTDEFKTYGANVKANARLLAEVLQKRGVRIVSGGTDTHVVLVDVSSKDLTGQQSQDALSEINITSNKNPIPFDSAKPSEWKGLRLGSSAGTTRGFGAKEFEVIGNLIADIFDAQVADETTRAAVIAKSRAVVAKLVADFPIYA
ncbi:serine hydroxymethyltransferase [Pseudomonas aeruginosa]|jgi:glycine hydroxymethyltransferase|uniref:serine hydroxymethyltransferase n=1 Tax=Pseudomonas TaxID=286 RepID=UPI00004DC392|nr:MULTISPECIES: serine hydroxymethyltransferase [Pseudomonas]MDQ3595082.1 serine hydroxymethyltransferase [Pseudomonadota bacterium]NPA19901.1 serine hydroxymethyltransferase [Gammaproteobacteria bacterium]QPN48228.1 serine hydroxymethyltransferase [Priestia aryabhattai]WHL30284.1 serine hydroxymethyltransferase [Pseudomonas juntendi]EGB98334.1 serine hydroxymethyltransferase [Pseudomonas sp. TJI-51]|eukprot:gene11388-13274_t